MIVALALIAAVCGVLMVRIGWGREAGGARITIGWALVAGGLAVLTIGDGAWGLALGASVATLAAFVALTHAAITAPRPRKTPPLRDTTTTVTLHSEGWTGLGRRFLVFLLVVPGAAAASMLVALAAQTLARAAGGETPMQALPALPRFRSPGRLSRRSSWSRIASCT